VSLEAPIDEEHDSQLSDFIEDEAAVAPVEAVGAVLQKEALGSVLATLTDRERKIMELRFGLRDGRPETLQEVGQRFGITRERIRQIEAKTLARLRSNRDSQRLQDSLD
jgi:RNA polymerase primary sigma factor